VNLELHIERLIIDGADFRRIDPDQLRQCLHAEMHRLLASAMIAEHSSDCRKSEMQLSRRLENTHEFGQQLARTVCDTL
jgi:hypothetical protein